MRHIHEKLRHDLRQTFPGLIGTKHDAYLALGRYLQKRPERFYSRDACEGFCSLLKCEMERNQKRLIKQLNSYHEPISQAISSLTEIARNEWHDIQIEDNEYDFMRFCDQTLHPTYLKLAEGILHKLILPLSTCSRLERNKSTDDLWKLSACLNEMALSSDQAVIAHCDSSIRNCIAHGKVYYREREVLYRDRNRECARSNREVYRMVDGLMDTCNGCALALKLFYLQNAEKGVLVPRSIMLEELQAETQTPYWFVDGCLESISVNGSNLVIYVTPRSRSTEYVTYMAISTGILAESCSPGFDQYHVFLSTPLALPGWAFLDGKKLKEIRLSEGEPSISAYGDALVNGFVCYAPYLRLPRWFDCISLWFMSFGLYFQDYLRGMRNKLCPVCIVPRVGKLHRNSWGAVLKASVVLEVSREMDLMETVRVKCAEIVRQSRRLANAGERWHALVRYLPIGFAAVSVYRADCRKREMCGLDSNLICSIQLKRLKRISVPDILGSTVEQHGKFRIAWNKSWLDEFSEGEQGNVDTAQTVSSKSSYMSCH